MESDRVNWSELTQRLKSKFLFQEFIAQRGYP